MVQVLLWWLGIYFFGWIGFPVARKVFTRHPDLGYPLAKTLGLGLVSYLIWLGGLGHLFPFSLGAVLITGFSAGLFFRWVLKTKKGLTKENRRLIFYEEGLFLLVFLSILFIRARQPDIRGLEKFMDYGFINSLLRSRYFPPQDMWFAGKSINYYYFGHLITAVMIKLAATPPEIGYNLMLATIAGLAFTSAMSISTFLVRWLRPNERRPWAWGLISAALVTFGGNLQLIYYWLKEKNLNNYWYADATRFIVEKFGASDNTIHEFPGYSFIVADLHGHLNSLPLVLFIFALSLRLVTTKKSPFKNRLPLLILFGFITGITFMTNAWDLPIYYLIFGLLILARFWPPKLNFSWIKETFLFLGPALLVSLAVISPFLATFENIAQGIALVDFHSPLWMLGFLWGFPLLLTTAFGWLFPSLPKRKRRVICALILGSWILIFLPEIIRVKDIYHFKHQRANTMFKLTYQAFIVFHLLAGPLFRLVGAAKRKFIFLFVLPFVLLTVISLGYPYFGFRSYYFSPPLEDPTLNGMNFLAHYYPSDYQAIRWLQNNGGNQPVVLEAVGESYSDFARVSTFTGFPTVIGWPVHEWLWRSDSITPYQRLEEVKLMYTDPGSLKAQALLRTYQVKFVFIGQLEKTAYPDLDENFFQSHAQEVFRAGQTVVYRL